MSRGPSGFRAAWALAAVLVFACFAASPVLASNPYFNVPICTAVGSQLGPQMVPDGTGGAIIVWYDGRSGHNIYAQRVNAASAPQWATNGVAVIPSSTASQAAFAIAPDGAGGVIVMWPDFTNPSDPDIRAQRLDGTGTRLWAPSGVAVCAAVGSQIEPGITSDGLGGAILFWRDCRNSPDGDIYAQRVDAGGTPQWAANGLVVCAAASAQFGPKVIADGANGAIACWLDNRGSNANVYVQRMDAAGNPQWTADGVAVGSPTSIQYFPDVISDDAGGAIVTWQNNITFPSDIFGQRVDATGTRQWTASGILLCSATDSQSSPVIAPDGAGGMIAAWADRRNGTSYDLYAQRFDMAGAAQWVSNGVAICAGVSHVNSISGIAPDGSGGAIICWTDYRPLPINSFPNLFAQRVTSSGAAQWTVNGTPVCIAAGHQSGTILPDGAGGMLAAWVDNRDCEFCYDIYAQQVDPSGSVINGPPETFGNIEGQVWAACPTIGTPLLGVMVDAFSAGTGDLLAAATTDASGHVTMPGVLAIKYILSVVTPLGYDTAPDRTLAVPSGLTASTNWTLACVAATGNPSSANFWKHQIGIATGGNGNAKVDGPTICSYLDLIESHFNNNDLNQVVVYAPPSGSTCAQKLNVAKALLNFGNSAADVDKARQQLTALLLNVAANYLALTDVISKDGATVSQAITYCDQLIDNPVGNRALAATIADKINGGQTLSAGMIPLSTAQIAYRAELALRTFRATPGAGSQSFSFTMGRPGSVRLYLYDVAGRLVARVLDGELGEGAQVARWTGTTVSGSRAGSGMYFARLETAGGDRTLKVVQLAR